MRLRRGSVLAAMLLLISCTSSRTPTQGPAIATATAGPPPVAAQPTTAPTATVSEPTAIPATPAPAPTASPEDRYLAIAQDAAMPSIRSAMGMPAGEWKASVINVGEGPELELRAPLNPATNNDQLVRLAQQNIAQIINALFVADPALARVVVIGTLPENGQEMPAVSLAVRRDAAPEWGAVVPADLATLAEFVDIKPDYQP